MAEYMEYEWRAQSIAFDPPLTGKYNSYNDNHRKQTKALKELISDSIEPEIKDEPPPTEEELLRFLYARKFDVEQSYRLLLSYKRHRNKNPHIFNDLKVSSLDIRALLQDGLPGVLPSRDRKGRRILLLNSANWDRSVPLVSIYRALLVTLEYLTTSKGSIENLANGFVVIVDWTEFPFSRSSQLTPSILRLMIEGLQDCFPAKFKGVHFVNQPWYVEAALLVIRRFLREDTAERIFVHGNNLSTLHEHVAQDVLPAELGGEQPSYDPKPWLAEITSQKSSQEVVNGT